MERRDRGSDPNPPQVRPGEHAVGEEYLAVTAVIGVIARGEHSQENFVVAGDLDEVNVAGGKLRSDGTMPGISDRRCLRSLVAEPSRGIAAMRPRV